MATDTTTPLCTWDEFTAGSFKTLARNYVDPQEQNDLLMEATRECEALADGRRLAPFTTSESHRLDGVDPDEYTDASNLPLDITGTLNASYAMALGSSTLVRHCWLYEFAPRYPEMWAYSNITVDITRSYGGGQILTPNQYVGPAGDSGHIWFNLGMFVPVGSYAQIGYSGGYTVAIPADLRRACKNMIAAILVRDLQPAPTHPDPEVLIKAAARTLAWYAKGGDRDAH